MNNTFEVKATLFSDYPDVLTVRQMQTALGIGRVGVYKLLESGKIQSFKVGHAYKIPRTALLQYIQQNCKRGEK